MSRICLLAVLWTALYPVSPLFAEPPTSDLPEAKAPERPSRPSMAPT